MKEVISRLTIEPVQNGFLVYPNEYQIAFGVRQVPYVFESMDNLLEFIKNNLSDDTNQ